ncbi:MAG: 30S ribosome-binding factor RbfA [Candidatus Azosocius agrarius]|nr:MAG: 30S ribosome-binding factor RbfA [Gammaproteobacteria bacterium]
MINNVKINKINDLIKKELSKIILYKIKDPRLNLIYISYVKTDKTLKNSKIYFTYLINNDSEYYLNLLNNAKNFFRHELSKFLNIYYIPKLNFYIDYTIKNTMKIESLFKIINNVNEKQ